MKKFSLFLFAILSFFFLFAVACGEDEQPKEVTYTVSFVTGTSEQIESQTVKENECAVEPTQQPTKDGYVFEGWYNVSSLYDFEDVVTSNLVLTAKWTAIYTVTFKVEGEVIDTQQVKAGESATPPQAPTIPGKDFVAWVGNYTNVQKNVEIVASYDTLQFLVTFVVDGEVYGDRVEVAYGEAATAPADPVKEGYTFTGWDVDFSNITEALVVTAQFETVEYTITYYAGDTVLSNANPTTYTVEDAIDFADYSVEGTYFMGWFNNAEFLGQAALGIEKGTTGDLEFYALNATVNANGGADCWETTAYATVAEAAAGIDAISTLPETFEMDFFKYLSDNGLLTSSTLHETMVADTWEKFSALNPNHNGDPRRIWNDTSTNAAGGANGYIALFLYDTLSLNEDGTIKDVEGGFLGTEPYKSKYRGLLDVLAVIYQHKVDNNKYDKLNLNTARVRAFMGFVIDGYFYGTQGIKAEEVNTCYGAARNSIPGTTFGYKAEGTGVVKVEYENAGLPNFVKDGYVFDGWYIDPECTKKLGSEAITGTPVLYAGWKVLA